MLRLAAPEQPVAVRRQGVALRRAEPAAWAEAAAVALPVQQVLAAQPKAAPAGLAELDAGGLQPAAPVAVARLPEEEAVPDAAAAVRLPAAERDAAAGVLPPVAVRAVAAEERPRAAPAVRVSEVRRRAEPDGAARPSAAVWAAPLSTLQQGDQPAPSARERSAHARGCLQIAQP